MTSIVENPYSRVRTAVIAASIAIATLSIALVWLSQPARHPFRFLEGQTPVIASEEYRSDYHITDRAYAIPAAFDEFNSRIATELAARGFVENPNASRFSVPTIRYERDGGKSYVILYKDMRYERPTEPSPHAIIGRDAPGWVSVQVYLDVPQTAWEQCCERLREWWAKNTDNGGGVGAIPPLPYSVTKSGQSG